MNYTRIKDENAKLENDLKNQKRNTYIEGHVSKLVKLLGRRLTQEMKNREN